VKLWRPDAWANLAQTLIDRYDCQIILSGSSDEAGLCWQIAAGVTPSPLSVAGQTNLAQLAALLSRATLVIGPDTGPVKLAAAVGTPTIELYGPVDVRKFGPWGDSGRQRYIVSGLTCIPCNHLAYPPPELPRHFCVRGLAVIAVLSEAADLLGGIETSTARA
jgi:ADP-heptose:LPS heptosyltransferase